MTGLGGDQAAMGRHFVAVSTNLDGVTEFGIDTANRITETLIGTVAGLIAGFVLTAPQVEPAEEAVADLTRTMADPLDRMVAGLNDGSVNDSARAWLDQARALGSEIRRVDGRCEPGAGSGAGDDESNGVLGRGQPGGKERPGCAAGLVSRCRKTQ